MEIHPSVKLSRSWNNNDTNNDDLSSTVQLEDCIESFIKWENLDNKEMFNCKKCKTLQPADKKLDIWKLPPCLVRLKQTLGNMDTCFPLRYSILNVFNYQIIVG